MEDPTLVPEVLRLATD